MLGKMFKYDFKAVSRFLWLIYGLVIFSAIGLRISIEVIEHLDAPVMGVLSTITMSAAYVISVIAVVLGTMIVLIVHFYKSMMQDCGYFFFTLPVSYDTHLIAKILLGALFIVIATVVIGLSVIPFAIGNLPLSDIWDGFKELFEGIAYAFGTGNCVVITIMTLILALFAGPMEIYFCIIVGQLWRKHRIAGAFITFIALDFIRRIVSSLVTLAFGFSVGKIFTAGNVDQIYRGMMYPSLLFSLIVMVAEYFVSRYILKNKLNLE